MRRKSPPGWIRFRLKRGIEGTLEARLGVGAGPGLITTESKTQASKTRDRTCRGGGVSDGVSSGGMGSDEGLTQKLVLERRYLVFDI